MKPICNRGLVVKKEDAFCGYSPYYYKASIYKLYNIQQYDRDSAKEELRMRFASLVLFSDAVFDSVQDAPFSGGVAICGERIEYVGTKAAVEKYIGPCTEVRDFGDRLIMPGFCEGHMHVEGAANTFCGLKVQGLDTAAS